MARFTAGAKGTKRPEVRDGASYPYTVSSAGVVTRDTGTWFKIEGKLEVDGTKHSFPVTLCIQAAALNMRWREERDAERLAELCEAALGLVPDGDDEAIDLREVAPLLRGCRVSLDVEVTKGGALSVRRISAPDPTA